MGLGAWRQGSRPLPGRATGRRAPRTWALRPTAARCKPGGSMKRSRELKPLSSEHHQALLVAFQLKQGLAGHADSAGAPKDLPGLLQLARRFEEQVFRT